VLLEALLIGDWFKLEMLKPTPLYVDSVLVRLSRYLYLSTIGQCQQATVRLVSIVLFTA
jgi:hypothetical protein